MATRNHSKRAVVRWIKRGLVIVVSLGIAVAIVRALMPHPVTVDTAVASRGPLEVEIREDGQTRVRDRYVVAAPIGGQLERITIEPGTAVDRGSVLARVQPPLATLVDDRTRAETVARLAAARARVRQASAGVERAKQAQQFAAREEERARALAAGGAISGVDRERAELSAKVASEDLAAVEHERAAALSEIEALRAVLEPGHTEQPALPVTAPTRGRVLRVLRESEGPVATGTPLLEIGDPQVLEVVIDVLSRDAERIRPGMPVDIETAADTTTRGHILSVEPSATTRISALGVEEQRVNVIATFDAPPGLGDAFRVDARIVIWHGDDVLQIPASALFRDHGHWAVYVASAGRAEMREVVVGQRGRTNVEIVKGLAPGDHVILRPSDQVHDATRVAER